MHTSPAKNDTTSELLIEQRFPDVEFHREIGTLLSEIVQKSKETGALDPETRIQAYETIIERTARILRWINRNTMLRTRGDSEAVLEISREKDELEIRWKKLLQKATDLKKENRELREKAAKTTTNVKELAALMLGLSPDASEAAIKAAYREKVKRAHPDAGGDPDFFKAVTEAMLIMIKGTKK